ncbi:CPBP family glutamic-type intramembrane protease [Neobacillus bataviensis]|uniref:CPBP family glutamic-type intramembrane protease n=1 Tax=Neobacillus bataviensis TaxID=220685 RepID=UPI001CBF7B71|nr:CPBP family glutamic-type intramembrane protease [Neobacillus bataviensis]
MISNLTKPISKKLLFAMLIVAVGAEVLLYLARYSYLASTLYDAVMVSSFFVGWKIYRRLGYESVQQKTKRQRILQFTGSFLIFFVGSTIINIYSSAMFTDFNDDYDQYVEDYTDNQSFAAEDDDIVAADGPVWAFFDKVDMIGGDLYTDALAGLEEVWRLCYIILLLMVFKKIFRRRWESGSRDIFLMFALFLTSIIFGIDHTLDAEQPWSIKLGAIVTFGNMGLLLGLILLWTRSLWLTVIVHSLYDITATLSWYYIDYAVEFFALVVLFVHVVLFSLEKMHQKLPMDMQELSNQPEEKGTESF